MHMKTNMHNVVHMTVMHNVGSRLCVEISPNFTCISPFLLLTSIILPLAGCLNTCILASTHKLAVYGRDFLGLCFFGNIFSFLECNFFGCIAHASEYYGVSRFFTFRVNMPVAAHTLVTCTLNSLMSLLFDARREIISV